jgi:hypothetical protein
VTEERFGEGEEHRRLSALLEEVVGLEQAAKEAAAAADS